MKNDIEIQHLYLRAGFGLSPKEWQQRRNWSRKEALTELFNLTKLTRLADSFSSSVAVIDMMVGKESLTKKQQNKKRKTMIAVESGKWIERMGDSIENALLERMTLFWNGHFACEAKSAKRALLRLDSLSEHALGKFRDLVIGVAKDPSMIVYLNNQQNRKGDPNENFARELMELFTIGIGNYTEKDVKEAARAFTGWKKDKKSNFFFNKNQHDFGKKTFMEKTGNFTGEDIIDIILKRRETADFITRKIYKYFVNEQVNEEHVRILADKFYQSDYDIKNLMYSIFESNWFYEPANIGTKIKSPVDFMTGLMRSLNLKGKKPDSYFIFEKALGQTLFKPPNVAGWVGGRNWIDNSTLMIRLNFVSSISNFNKRNKKANKKGRGFQHFSLDFKPILDLAAGLDNETALALLTEYLLPSKQPDISPIRKFSFSYSQEDFLKKACIHLTSLPEYQLC